MITNLCEEISYQPATCACAQFAAQATPAQAILERSVPPAGPYETRSDSPARPRVLVADDEKVIANTLAAILNMSGFECGAVYSGRAAIEAVSSFEPDILISDVVMPEMTGIEAAIEILGLRPNCKVLLFSGQAATIDLLQQARAQGYSFDILLKPVHPAELLRRLRALEVAA